MAVCTYAQRQALVACGLGPAASVSAVHLPFYHSDPGTIGKFALALEAVQCLVLIASIFPTEHALKKTFRDDGTRREIGGTR